jgi:hypothetical protein
VVEKMAEFGLLELSEKSRTLRREITLFSNSTKNIVVYLSAYGRHYFQQPKILLPI